ncbi:TetR/AcrR family transcriptional regulator [Aeromonas dhakensis]|uniref:TetR/AcrR family transcriptional regulator n=1 Tax=Aeromonas dhakensis TaxID=196024 RepID=UPI00203C7515|nr:helix-turn-helix domain-containing protein [Aeromonas dhakensis]
MNIDTQHRKKDPVRLYRQLLESAATIAGRDGIAALSLNAVAYEAGVSKGGLLHHFPNKQALIFALFARLLAIMEDGHLSTDGGRQDRLRPLYPCLPALSFCS